jgi:hypothetical protein
LPLFATHTHQLYYPTTDNLAMAAQIFENACEQLDLNGNQLRNLLGQPENPEVLIERVRTVVDLVQRLHMPVSIAARLACQAPGLNITISGEEEEVADEEDVVIIEQEEVIIDEEDNITISGEEEEVADEEDVVIIEQEEVIIDEEEEEASMVDEEEDEEEITIIEEDDIVQVEVVVIYIDNAEEE